MQKINLYNHKRDFLLCQDFLSRNDCREFEAMLCATLKSIERYLKYNKKRLGIGDVYPDIFGGVSETIAKKLHTFRGGSLFSTWARGIVRYELLVYYSKRKKAQECELKETVALSEKNKNSIDEFIEMETLNEYFSVLNKNEICVFKALRFILKD